MDDRTQPDIAATSQAKRHKPDLLRSERKLYIGIDIGSTSSDVVVLDHTDKVVFCDYRRTKGQPIRTARSQLDELFKQINPSDVGLAAATGSAGRLLAELLDITFVNEVPAQAAAACQLYPHLHQATIIDMGGQDTKLIFLAKEQGKGRIQDFTLNTVCAAGTGSFLDQQAQRLGINIEGEFGELALLSKMSRGWPDDVPSLQRPT